MVVTKNGVPLINGSGEIVDCVYECCAEDDPPTLDCCECQQIFFDEFDADLPDTMVVDIGTTTGAAIGLTHQCTCPDCSTVDPCALLCNPFEERYYEALLYPCPGVVLGEGPAEYDPVLNLGCCACQDDAGDGHGDPCTHTEGDGHCVQLKTVTNELPACSTMNQVSFEFVNGISCFSSDGSMANHWAFAYFGGCNSGVAVPFQGSWAEDGTCTGGSYVFMLLLARDVFVEGGMDFDLSTFSNIFKDPVGSSYHWYVLSDATHSDLRTDDVIGFEYRIWRSPALPVVDGCVLSRGTFQLSLILHSLSNHPTLSEESFASRYGTTKICGLPDTLLLHAL